MLQNLGEIAGILEFAIDAGKSHEGDLIQLAEVLHHQVAEDAAFDLAVVVRENLVLDGGNDRFDLVVAYWAFPAGPFEAAANLLAVERHPRAVFLDDFDRQVFDILVGRIAAFAAQAFAAATDGIAFLACPRVDDAVVVGMTKRAAHRAITGSLDRIKGTRRDCRRSVGFWLVSARTERYNVAEMTGIGLLPASKN
jgi:hypothetical protein